MCGWGFDMYAQAVMDATGELASIATRYTGRDFNIHALEEPSLKYEPPTVVDDNGHKV